MLKVGKPRIPKFTFEVEDEEQLVQKMGEKVARMVKARALRGRGSQGRLPKPKAGGRAWRETGTLIDSIGVVMRKSKKGKIKAVVRPLGKRSGRDFKGARKRARARTLNLRAQAKAAFTERGELKFGARVGKRGLNLGRVRRRSADTNAALAGILSVPPQDRRGISGNRGSYRVMEATDRERKAAVKIARKGKFTLKGNPL